MKDRGVKILVYTATAALVGTVVYALFFRKKGFKPVYVSGEFKGKTCDEFHAFENTGGRTIGGMNTKVRAELMKLYNQGYNPEVTEVEVEMDASNYKTKWKVKIEQSKDGKAWLGITSRGSAGGGAYYRATAKETGQDPETVKRKVEGYVGESNIDFKQLRDYLYNMDSKGKALGKCPVRQVFYVYTLPKKYPPK
jgi:hypothetical protein